MARKYQPDPKPLPGSTADRDKAKQGKRRSGGKNKPLHGTAAAKQVKVESAKKRLQAGKGKGKEAGRSAGKGKAPANRTRGSEEDEEDSEGGSEDEEDEDEEIPDVSRLCPPLP